MDWEPFCAGGLLARIFSYCTRRDTFPAVVLTGQMNVLTVITIDSDIYLYINSHFLVHERDSTLSVGEIGLAASDYDKSTDVLFYQAEVWSLMNS